MSDQKTGASSSFSEGVSEEGGSEEVEVGVEAFSPKK